MDNKIQIDYAYTYNMSYREWLETFIYKHTQLEVNTNGMLYYIGSNIVKELKIRNSKKATKKQLDNLCTLFDGKITVKRDGSITGLTTDLLERIYRNNHSTFFKSKQLYPSCLNQTLYPFFHSPRGWKIRYDRILAQSIVEYLHSKLGADCLSGLWICEKLLKDGKNTYCLHFLFNTDCKIVNAVLKDILVKLVGGKDSTEYKIIMSSNYVTEHFKSNKRLHSEYNFLRVENFSYEQLLSLNLYLRMLGYQYCTNKLR